ncbi:MAG: hypothetical protein BGO43_03260 [Gammaproteobacteria bacterium 39-13]|nr:hypothetical protein [Gammaproteobacteria bacterium]OJV92031.1 MAG: hypothetical protein BGO43_03260 [Gammaproteobacteria bacterium 39-13]
MLSGIQYVTGLLSKLVWGETEYKLDLSRIGFIWFSDNPNEFMPAANQLRLIQNRLRNPNMDFYFVYSSKCLSQQAMNELEEFANNHNLYLIDFDTLLENAEKTELDNDIFLIAKEERDHALKNTGGSLAAASDGTRTLEPLLEICANYIDCDVDFDFSQMPRFHRINVPVIIPGRAHDVGMGFKFPLINNSFVGVAVTSEEDPSIHPEAKEKLNWVKERIQKHYFSPSITTLLQEFTGTPTIAALNPALNVCVQKLFARCQNDIFAYRQALSNIPSMTLHHKLYKESVIKYSGPDAWAHLFKDTLEMCNGMELPLMMEIFLEELEKANELQNGLTDCFLYNINPEQNIDGLPKSDLSWTPYGKEKMQKRSEEIDKNVTVLQAHCRSYLARSKCR